MVSAWYSKRTWVDGDGDELVAVPPGEFLRNHSVPLLVVTHQSDTVHVNRVNEGGN